MSNIVKASYNNSKIENDDILNIQILIKLLNEHDNIYFEKKKYLIDSYPSLKFDYNINIDILIYILLIANNNIIYTYNNISSEISPLKVNINNKIINDTKDKIIEVIKNISIDNNIKKNILSLLYYNKDAELNDNIYDNTILFLTAYFNINLIIYNTDNQIIKCYYFDKYLDKNLPFVILKEINGNYNLLFIDNKYVFNFTHPLITDIINELCIISFDNNKKLEYLNNRVISDIIIVDKPIIKLPSISNKLLKFIKTKNYIIKHEYFYNKIIKKLRI